MQWFLKSEIKVICHRYLSTSRVIGTQVTSIQYFVQFFLRGHIDRQTDRQTHGQKENNTCCAQYK